VRGELDATPVRCRESGGSLARSSWGIFDTDSPALPQPPVGRAQEQVQFVAALVEQGMAQEESEVGRAGGVRDGVAPGEAASEEDALGECVGGGGVEQIPENSSTNWSCSPRINEAIVV